MSKTSKELRLWAKDDIVPSDLRLLCKNVANRHDVLLDALKDVYNSGSIGQAKHIAVTTLAAMAVFVNAKGPKAQSETSDNVS